MFRKIIPLVVAVGFCACAGNHKKGSSTDPSKSNRTAIGRVDDGSKCDPAQGREAQTDLNQDGRDDVRRVYKTIGDKEILICREADMNFDGNKDVFVFFDTKGAIVRDELDLDYDKQIDIISTYANGKTVKQEIDSNSDGFVDRVRFLKDDLPVRLEGDTNNDGQVDLWEYYEEGVLVRLGIDEDGDGRADTWSRDADALKEKEGGVSSPNDADLHAESKTSPAGASPEGSDTETKTPKQEGASKAETPAVSNKDAVDPKKDPAAVKTTTEPSSKPAVSATKDNQTEVQNKKENADK
jgi:hypothetical protein